jgi:sterol desaturase/sphingolipid hydroxylase (fatty acid hydroxylase superfamily)
MSGGRGDRDRGMNPQDRQPNSRPPQDDAWLARPSTIRLLWWVFAAVLALSVAAEVVFKVKGYFGLDEWLGFGAVYGFLACLAMVLVAKALGWVLKRPAEYYQEPGDD